MSYRCPICLRRTKTASAMATHMMGTSDLIDKHQNWFEAHGISLPNLVGLSEFGKGNYTPLITVIEKECKIGD